MMFESISPIHLKNEHEKETDWSRVGETWPNAWGRRRSSSAVTSVPYYVIKHNATYPESRPQLAVLPAQRKPCVRVA